MKWSDFDYWKSGEWQVVEEKLKDAIKAHKVINPNKSDLFKALDLTPFEDVRVIILGQDPYPEHRHASGIAFSTFEKDIPASLQMIFKEYVDDLHYTKPTSGDLTKWCKQGVLLWNVIPSCEAGKSLSHDWDEWEYLTREIVEKVSKKGRLVVALGNTARYFLHFVNADVSETLWASHPSPRGNLRSVQPFLGSRLFTTINAKLAGLGVPTIDWKL